LYKVVLYFHFSQSLPSLDQLVQRVVRANFQQNVHILVVLKHVFELNDMVVVERFVDLDFCDKLNYQSFTFCLALERLSVLLGMILAARTFLV
jgi:hypothetical protein